MAKNKRKKKKSPVTAIIIFLIILVTIVLTFIISTYLAFTIFDTDVKTEIETVEKDTTLKLLIKEGQTQQDIARTLEEMGVVTYDEFMEACNNIDVSKYSFLRDIPINGTRKSVLEGYLYPDTYFINDYDSSEVIINKLLARFDELFTLQLQRRATSMGLSIDEVVIIASMIEKEIKIADERPIAASVIFNRLEQDMPLQLDATVLYALGEHKDRTLLKDTEVNSPYNTYNIKGLPIGPISNPSIQAIESVLNASKTDYLYYVLKDANTGEHFYTKDYNEFLKAKDEYIKTLDEK